MQRACESCGETFEARRSDRMYCGERCKKRAQRGHKAGTVVPLPSGTVGTASSLVEAVRAELEEADRLESWLGQQALTLATRIAAGQDTGSGLAALNREFRSTMAEAVKGVNAPTSAIAKHKDELAARRRA